ncbi:MAG TPA: sigma-54 dependent transcriptional regulator [Acetobacteraceae bacterium]|nr:sigma-54 dependent transcriptional regulator [Acetobacteraceae bacterium]
MSSMLVNRPDPGAVITDRFVRPEDSDRRNEPAPRLIGNSPAMRDVLEQIGRFAGCDIPVLITGEAGTGKKLVARTIHANSRRCAAPFVAVHCSASTASAIDLELFGQERHSSPGTDGRRGLLERAAGGTALLEEIGNLSSVSQALLRRLLETSEVIRLGGRDPIRVDVRLITTATVVDPESVAAPTLGPDLYYRLSVLRLHLPPLRDRKDDIEALAAYLLRRIAHRLSRDVGGFSSEALAALCRHRWPGNARELIGVIQRAVVLCRSPQIERRDLRFEEAAPPAPEIAQTPARPPPGSTAELNLLLETLQRVRFSITRAAQELKVSRVTLYRMLERNGLELRHNAVVRGSAAGEEHQG